jgi:hypothetical protein
LELALRSDELQLASENDAYALVAAWAACETRSLRQETFSRLVKCLRLHHMSPALLTAIATRSSFRGTCPSLLDACANALTYQSVITTLSVQDVANRDAYLASAKPSRARREAFPYKLEGQVALSRCLALTDDGRASLFLGVTEGYGVGLTVRK